MKTHISKTIAIIFCIILLLHHTTLPNIVAGTTILTPHGLVPIENIATGDYLISYKTDNKSIVPSRVVSITTLTTDLMLAIEIDHTIVYAVPDQLFYDPYIRQWLTAKELTTENVLLGDNSHCYSCHGIEPLHKTTTVYRISTESPHTFFISDAHILTHNFFPAIVVDISFFLGSGIEFGGLSLAATLLGSTAIGITLFNKHKKNAASFDKEAHNYSQNSGSFNHDPDDDEKKREYRNTARESHNPLINKEARQVAENLGYKEIKDHPCGNTRNKPVFTNGKEYISPDADGHNGGIWKIFNRKGALQYSMDANLKNIVKIY